MSDDIDRLLEDPLIQLVRTSIEIEGELHASPTIKMVLKKARESALSAMQNLVTANPNNADVIRALQNEVIRQQELAGWIAQAVQEGRNAEITIADEDGEE